MPTRSLGPGDTYVRAKRIDLKRTVTIEAKTLGTRIQYYLDLENFSRSGLFMTSGKPQHIPYQVNTLVEMTVDPRGEVLEAPVRCLGKIVRSTQGAGPQFGVQLIMMEARDELEWQKAIATLESFRQDQGKLLTDAA